MKLTLAKEIAGRPEMREGVVLCDDLGKCDGETVVFADSEFIRQKRGGPWDAAKPKQRPVRKSKQRAKSVGDNEPQQDSKAEENA